MKSFKSKSWIIAIICNLFFPEISIAQIKIMDEQFIFDSASFPSCHASTIVELKNGDILTAWFGGTAEGNDDVAIWSSVKSKATGWSVPRVLIKEPGASMYNPVLFYTRDAVLWLYYKYGKSPMTWSAGKMYSVDNGKTWSDPIHLPAGLYGPIRAKPLVLTDGTIVSGTSVESFKTWTVWVERSTDHGKSWKKIGPIVVDPKHYIKSPEQIIPTGTDIKDTWHYPEGIIQPSIISLGGNHLRMYCRSTLHIGRISIADSYNNGLSWTSAKPIEIPNPNSGIDALNLKNKKILLVYNHTMEGRSPLNLAWSINGLDFKMIHSLETEPGEFSYPSMIQAADGSIHLSYTWNRKKIKYLHFTAN